MSETAPSPPMWVGPLLGGLSLSLVSTIGNWVVEKEAPKTKAVARDFVLGSILMLLIMQILPDSTSRLFAAILGAFGATKLVTQNGGDLVATVVESVMSASPPSESVAAFVTSDGGGPSLSSEEYEVRVGVPRF